MSLLGVRLTMFIGPTVAVLAPSILTENLEQVEVSNTDDGRSGFQISFRAGRANPFDMIEEPLLKLPLLRAYNRVILVVTFGVRPRVLMDGLITNVQYAPSNEPGGSRVTITGEDVSLAMDLEEQSVEHPAQPDLAIVAKLIATYAQYGMIPQVIPPVVSEPPLPVERIPVQQGTDLEYIEELGERHGYVFYVDPGPAPFVNTAYWGPPKRVGLLQKALSLGFGADTNLNSIDFSEDALTPEFVDGDIQDTRTNIKLPIKTFVPTRIPLASQPTWLTSRPKIRTKRFGRSGLSAARAYGEAQGMTDRSNDRVLTATGEFDAIRYGDVLRARGIVGVRGVGTRHDGLYYVQSVQHRLSEGQYTQSFTLGREGPGTTTPVVRP